MAKYTSSQLDTKQIPIVQFMFSGLSTSVEMSNVSRYQKYAASKRFQKVQLKSTSLNFSQTCWSSKLANIWVNISFLKQFLLPGILCSFLLMFDSVLGRLTRAGEQKNSWDWRFYAFYLYFIYLHKILEAPCNDGVVIKSNIESHSSASKTQPSQVWTDLQIRTSRSLAIQP